jgi:methylenetetrahydrofolate dehydrogenase (NADP+)/methenyltetrahydrofolate cyclohydrolase
VTERAAIIDGVRAADELIAALSRETAEFTRRTGITPGLALIAIDDDPAQRLYVRKKLVQCVRAGIRPVPSPLQASATTAQVVRIVESLNADPSVHGIFVQWPLPGGVELDAVAKAIAPGKDIDGMASSRYSPATVLACYRLLRTAIADIVGLEVVIAYGSDVFAQPIARILRAANCKVTLARRNSGELAGICRRADILIAALSEPEVIRGEWIKPGAIVIDAGVNAVAKRDGGLRYVGDVKFDEAVRVAGAITPVPGGVGPMTIACLLENTLAAAKHST